CSIKSIATPSGKGSHAQAFSPTRRRRQWLPASASAFTVRHSGYLAFVDGFCNEPKSERTDYFSDRIEFGLRRTAQRFVETFSGKTCLLCDVCHAFGACDRIKRIADELGIVCRQRLRKV